VERIGAVDHVIGGDGAMASFAPGTSHRIRIQFGVFDDADGAAPPGGYIGWNIGTLATTDGINTRTPGRLSPFNFAPNPPGNGIPSADPFGVLTAIDNTLGTQSPVWGCGPDGLPLPMPPPTIRGLNTFVSTFEFTTRAPQRAYMITLGGHTVSASGWGIIGTPTPPDCPYPPGGCDFPATVTYAPMTLPPAPITATLLIVVPSPGIGAMLWIASVLAARRKR
jgi:hypothetical protein